MERRLRLTFLLVEDPFRRFRHANFSVFFSLLAVKREDGILSSDEFKIFFPWTPWVGTTPGASPCPGNEIQVNAGSGARHCLNYAADFLLRL